MSDIARVRPAEARAGAEVVGYVEAVTDDAALGWTWRVGSQDRLAVELRLGEQTVARAAADRLREDLARSGIGDGRHAFVLPIPDELRPRSGELRVVAIGESGAAVPLDAPPPADAASNALVSVQRGIDMLIGSQRMLHRNLQAALLQQPSVSNALTEIATTQAGLQESLATFELFAVRLEQAIANREMPNSARETPHGLTALAALAALALVASSWALWRTMAG